MFGTVAASGLRPRIELSVSGEERAVEVRAAVDTGFTGDLALPADVIDGLALPRREVRSARLADGRETSVRTYAGRVLWHGSVTGVLVLEAGAGADPLAGMGLLVGSELRVEARPGGDVVITELP